MLGTGDARNEAETFTADIYTDMINGDKDPPIPSSNLRGHTMSVWDMIGTGAGCGITRITRQ